MIKKIIKRYREAIKRQVVTECEARVGELRGEMSEGEFLARWAEGQLITVDEAVEVRLMEL